MLKVILMSGSDVLMWGSNCWMSTPCTTIRSFFPAGADAVLPAAVGAAAGAAPAGALVGLGAGVGAQALSIARPPAPSAALRKVRRFRRLLGFSSGKRFSSTTRSLLFDG